MTGNAFREFHRPFSLRRWLAEYPGRGSLVGFVLLILAGAGLLMLPPATADGRGLGFVDSLFMSASAACVTGLAVVDPATRLSGFGQAVILLLIQVGGLGVMTVSTLLLFLAGRRPGLSERAVLADSFTHSRPPGPGRILREVLTFVLVIEATGTLLLFVAFLKAHPPGRAFVLAGFHSISAFCNAGFSLFSDSLTGWRGDAIVNLTVCALILLGGIGFPVLSELRAHFPFSRRTWRRLTLHSRLCLSGTAFLVVAGFLLFLSMEWRHTLSGLAPAERFWGALFQSVTTRTAGFNTLPFDRMANETLFITMILMFIGGCPGSCAGGVKTTTVTTLTFLGLARLAGSHQPHVFRRAISGPGVWRAINVVMTSGAVVALAFLALLVVESAGMSGRERFPELLFEVVSAMGTVGLSTGITPALGAAGKLILTGVMLLGRLGPLMVGIAISRQREIRYRFAEEDIMVG